MDVVKLLSAECGLKTGATIADIGSGTGLLSRIFLDAGLQVIGVEPNAEMRAAGDHFLAAYQTFRSVAGTAEATTLESASCDLAIAGQAFHWFDVARTRNEWTRILKPGCFASLIWNERWRGTEVMREIEEVIDRFATDSDRSIREGGRSRIAGFFAPSDFRKAEFTNHQEFDFEGLMGRVLSCSYIPNEDDPRSKEMAHDLKQVFDKHQRGGVIRFEYRTEVYWGRLSG